MKFHAGMKFHVVAGMYMEEQSGPYCIDSVDFLEDQIGLKMNDTDPPKLFHYGAVELA
jgi:hypothetical protein